MIGRALPKSCYALAIPLALILLFASAAPLNAQYHESDRARQEFWRQAAIRREQRKRDSDNKDKERNRTAASLSIRPGQCIAKYQSVLRNARSLDELLQFFSASYRERSFRDLSATEKSSKLAEMKSMYAYPLDNESQARIKESVTDGQATVWLEGKAMYMGKWKGVKAKFTLVPESNYWRIEGSDITTGLNVIYIPKPR